MTVRQLPGPLAGPYDYLDAVSDLCHYEVVDGYILMTPAPGIAHQRLLARILAALTAAAPPDVEVLPAPLDWILGPGQVRQPDIVVVHRAALTGNQLTVPPLLVVEILSPGSAETDLVVKPDAYGRAGLRHYWVVEPDTRTVRIFVPEGATLIVERTVTADSVDVREPFPVTVPLRL